MGCSIFHWDPTCSFGFLSLFPDLVAQRGEKLELLIDKTENLVDSVSLEKDLEMGNGVSASLGRSVGDDQYLELLLNRH